MLRNILLVHIELSFRTIALSRGLGDVYKRQRAEILILNIVAISTYYSEGIIHKIGYPKNKQLKIQTKSHIKI